MHIDTLYKKNKFTYSFEIFPPKTEKGEKNLWNEMEKMKKFSPGFISVTYGAGGSTREKTLDIAIKLKNQFDFSPLVHFTCVGSSKDEIADYLGRVKKLGIENILALRGDPPIGEEKFVAPVDGFSYANELVEFIKGYNGFTIATAAYPEGHQEAPDFEADIENLKRKVDAGSDMLITQLFYENERFYKFMNLIEKKGIKIPVIPGIMPVTGLNQVQKITGMCGASVPEKLSKALSLCSSDQQVCDSGVEYSIKQCQELKSWGVKGLHFYTLNKSDIVGTIIENL